MQMRERKTYHRPRKGELKLHLVGPFVNQVVPTASLSFLAYYTITGVWLQADADQAAILQEWSD
jgi:hypothetical protein